MRQSLVLDGQWSLSFLPETAEGAQHPDALHEMPVTTIPASVPGTVEQALLDAALIARSLLRPALLRPPSL